MIAAPWNLLSIGIFVLLVGSFLNAIRKRPGGDQRVIDSNLSDDEIMENLQDGGHGRAVVWMRMVVSIALQPRVRQLGLDPTHG